MNDIHIRKHWFKNTRNIISTPSQESAMPFSKQCRTGVCYGPMVDGMVAWAQAHGVSVSVFVRKTYLLHINIHRITYVIWLDLTKRHVTNTWWHVILEQNLRTSRVVGETNLRCLFNMENNQHGSWINIFWIYHPYRTQCRRWFESAAIICCPNLKFKFSGGFWNPLGSKLSHWTQNDNDGVDVIDNHVYTVHVWRSCSVWISTKWCLKIET